ncbi:MAG TPA: DUF697 domain-containing protein [Gemmatimonadaceae bacterium]|nr:DUF697 domain-containing protein [Gemmatimonadaceae bacterium]
MATAAPPLPVGGYVGSKQERAEHAMRRAMLLSFGAGFIPVPWVDVAGISAAQLNMLHRMAEIYGIPFREDWGKAVIGALLGGVSARWIADSVIGTGAKLVPLVGNVIAYATLPVAAAATSYAVGKIFIQHFESGGTFLDFEPSRVRNHFAHYYAEGKRVAKQTLAGTAPGPAPAK